MDVRLPNLGEGADSGSVVALFVKEGDEIKKGQTILELENEKAVAPIPSPVEGTVTKIRVKEGDKLSVGQVILTVSGGGAAAQKEAPGSAKTKRQKQAPDEPKAEDEGQEEAEGEEEAPEPVAEDAAAEEGGAEDEQAPPGAAPPPASPTIRRLARDLGINLARVKGSERGGRIVLADLRAYIHRLEKMASAARKKAPKPRASERIDFSKWGPIDKRPASAIRQTISQRMLENWNTIPHVTQFDEADVTRLMELRKKHAESYQKKEARLTLTCFAVKALVQCLQKFPIFNTSFDEDEGQIIYKGYFHIGIAVDTDAGLMVPVIRDADRKSLLELAHDLSDLAGRARDRKIALDELKGGSFTISNQGGIGGAHFTPIINKPEVAILGLGRGVLKPAMREGKIEPRTMLPLCLSYDHRVIDGGQAARFIQELLAALENFEEAAIQI